METALFGITRPLLNQKSGSSSCQPPSHHSAQQLLSSPPQAPLPSLLRFSFHLPGCASVSLANPTSSAQLLSHGCPGPCSLLAFSFLEGSVGCLTTVSGQRPLQRKLGILTTRLPGNSQNLVPLQGYILGQSPGFRFKKHFSTA